VDRATHSGLARFLAGVILLVLIWVAALRRRVEEKTEVLRAVLESTADGILAVNSEGQAVARNRKFLDMWRIPEALRNGHSERPYSNSRSGN